MSYKPNNYLFMRNKDFNKGLALTALGSFWWGVIGGREWAVDGLRNGL